MIHPFAGVLSAYGMGLADVRALRDRAVETRLDTQGAAALEEALDTLAGESRAELEDQGIAPERIVVHRRAHVRYEGTDTPDLVEAGTAAQMKARFEDAHRRRYGFVMAEKALVIEAASGGGGGSGGGANLRLPNPCILLKNPNFASHSTLPLPSNFTTLHSGRYWSFTVDAAVVVRFGGAADLSATAYESRGHGNTPRWVGTVNSCPGTVRLDEL